MFGLLKRWRRRKITAAPFPESWTTILREQWPMYESLPDKRRAELQRRMKIFLAEKSFEGCGGFEMTDEARVLIAAQACLLLLGNADQDYETLKSIIVYPRRYESRRTDVTEAGVVHEEDQTVLGESWDFGTVTLAWEAIEHGTDNEEDGLNVILHEFAHQLDQESGAADGAPLLRHRGRYKAWQNVLSREYERLQDHVRRGRRTVMDAYGATEPAEFFAVATECFFEKPRQLKKRRPELYEQLQIFYGQDPADELRAQRGQ